MKEILDVLQDARFSEVPSSTKLLILEMVLAIVGVKQEEYKKAHQAYTEELIRNIIGSPEQQQRLLKKLLTDTLHTPKAGRIVRAYAREVMDDCQHIFED
jgi:hypothetical protein